MIPLHTAPLALHDPMDPEKLDAMLALAKRLLAGRQARRAALIAQGEDGAAGVDTSIRLGRALVEQWRWATTVGAGRWPLPDWSSGWWGAWQHELAIDTALAAARARKRAADGDEDKIELAERCEVLAWYQHLDRHESRIVRMVDLMRYTPTAPALARAA